MSVELALYASYDIDGIIKYISRDSSKIAQRFTIKLIEYIYVLSIFPELGVVVQRQGNIRKLIYHNYIIIY